MYAESIREHFVRRFHHGAQGIPEPEWHWLSRYQIQCLPSSRRWCRLYYPSPHPGYPNLQCPRCLQVRYPHHFRLDDGWFVSWGRQFIIEFILLGGSLQTQLVAKEIFMRNFNAAPPTCWKSDQDFLTIPSGSEMCPPAVIWKSWTRDFFWVACCISLPCHISTRSWTLAILCNVRSSACFFISVGCSPLAAMSDTCYQAGALPMQDDTSCGSRGVHLSGSSHQLWEDCRQLWLARALATTETYWDVRVHQRCK